MKRARKAYWGALGLLVFCLVMGQMSPKAEAQVGLPPQHGGLGFGTPAGSTFTGGIITTPILAPAGSVGAPAYSFSAETNSGLFRYGASDLRMSVSGAFVAAFVNGGIYTPLLVLDIANGDVKLQRDAANTLALRNSTNAQTFNWYYSYTDASNYQRGALKTSASGIEIAAETAGSGADNLNIVLNPAGGGQVQFNAGGGGPYWYVSGVDGSFNTGFTDTVDLNGARNVGIIRSIQGSKTKALTEGAVTAVTQIAVPQTAGSNSADAVVQWTVYASDGTDTQTRRGSTYLAAVNKAGTETCTVGDIGTPVVAVSAGTLTCTASCITGLADVVQFALDCTSSLTQTSLNALVRLDMDQPNTVTPQ